MNNDNDYDNREMTFGMIFESVTKIENNEFVENSLHQMAFNYNLDRRDIILGIQTLKKHLHKLHTYDDCMRYLAGIYKINLSRSKPIRKGE